MHNNLGTTSSDSSIFLLFKIMTIVIIFVDIIHITLISHKREYFL